VSDWQVDTPTGRVVVRAGKALTIPGPDNDAVQRVIVDWLKPADVAQVELGSGSLCGDDDLGTPPSRPLK